MDQNYDDKHLYSKNDLVQCAQNNDSRTMVHENAIADKGPTSTQYEE